MSWRPWIRVLAAFSLLGLFYVDAARSDDEAQQQVLVALQEVNAAWHP
jgi:hypothetical protein